MRETKKMDHDQNKYYNSIIGFIFMLLRPGVYTLTM